MGNENKQKITMENIVTAKRTSKCYEERKHIKVCDHIDVFTRNILTAAKISKCHWIISNEALLDIIPCLRKIEIGFQIPWLFKDLHFNSIITCLDVVNSLVADAMQGYAGKYW